MIVLRPTTCNGMESRRPNRAFHCCRPASYTFQTLNTWVHRGVSQCWCVDSSLRGYSCQGAQYKPQKPNLAYLSRKKCIKILDHSLNFQEHQRAGTRSHTAKLNLPNHSQSGPKKTPLLAPLCRCDFPQSSPPQRLPPRGLGWMAELTLGSCFTAQHGCQDWQKLVIVLIQAANEARKVRIWHWGVVSASHQDIAQGQPLVSKNSLEAELPKKSDKCLPQAVATIVKLLGT